MNCMQTLEKCFLQCLQQKMLSFKLKYEINLIDFDAEEKKSRI